MIPVVVEKPMKCHTGSEIKGLCAALDLQLVRRHRDFPEKGRDVVDVLSQEVVKGKHIWLFGSKENIVGEVLNNLGNKEQSTSHLL